MTPKRNCFDFPVLMNATNIRNSFCIEFDPYKWYEFMLLLFTVIFLDRPNNRHFYLRKDKEGGITTPLWAL